MTPGPCFIHFIRLCKMGPEGTDNDIYTQKPQTKMQASNVPPHIPILVQVAFEVFYQ